MASNQQAQEGKVVTASFRPGDAAVYSVAAGTELHLDFDAANVVFDQQGRDLLITDANGDTIVIQNFVALAEAGMPPQVVFADGVVVAGDVFLFSVAQSETAADGAADGGGLNPYFGDPGGMIGGLAGDPLGGNSDPDFGGDIPPAQNGYDTPAGFVALLDSGSSSQVEPYVYPEIEDYNVHDHQDFMPLVTFLHAGMPDFEAPAFGDSWLVFGSGDDNTITGDTSQDILFGFNGNDVLSGLGGHDSLEGGFGDDVLYGGGGYDTLVLGDGEDVMVFNESSFSEGSAIVTVADFDIGVDGVKLEDGVVFEAARDFGTYVEAVLDNGTDDNVIVRLLGTSRADFDTEIAANGDAYAYSDTEQLLQYMAGNSDAWV